MRKSLAQVKVRRVLLVAVLIVLAALPVLLLVIQWAPFVLLAFQSSLEKPHLSENDLELALREFRGQRFEPGMHFDVVLPPRLRPMTKMGTVDLFRTADGRMIVLFKTSIGWKGNYRGIVFSDTPLRSEEVVSGTGRDRPSSILIDNFQTFIRKRINDRHYEVFYDLG
ncbi:hypothetical protein SAMN05444166_6387 [Singulisphaera sp. GP187]|uniref:hypothetical protein n=1 Tax=Singulisphaera sp. GP187 TaxID=1882752 RepID=UPI000929AF7D|nr:hypothetical protein [Singulisphaera sp. GP187]SIO60424.1 hypothetical protein SAMN05444166_6387 [Singulisphaera sp. GP187]